MTPPVDVLNKLAARSRKGADMQGSIHAGNKIATDIVPSDVHSGDPWTWAVVPRGARLAYLVYVGSLVAAVASCVWAAVTS